MFWDHFFGTCSGNFFFFFFFFFLLSLPKNFGIPFQEWIIMIILDSKIPVASIFTLKGIMLQIERRGLNSWNSPMLLINPPCSRSQLIDNTMYIVWHSSCCSDYLVKLTSIDLISPQSSPHRTISSSAWHTYCLNSIL